MGALHAGHVALFDAARRACDVVVASVFVNPSQFADPADLARYPRNEAHDERLAAGAGVDFCFAPRIEELYPSGIRNMGRGGWSGAGSRRRASSRTFSRRGDGLHEAVQHRRPARRIFRAEGRAAGRRRAAAGPRSEPRHRNPRRPDRPRPRWPCALLAQRAPLGARSAPVAVAIPRALDAGLTAFRDHRDPVAAARAVLSGAPGVDIDYVAVANFEGQPTLAIAARVGATRLIDNVPLDLEGLGNPVTRDDVERVSR